MRDTFTPPDGCLCGWSSIFEGELLGMVHTLTARHRRCPLHGPKPRWGKTGERDNSKVSSCENSAPISGRES